MSRDISSIKDDTAKRLAVVEATKYDRDEAQKALHDADKVHENLLREVNRRQTVDAAKEQQRGNDKIHEDHERRQRAVERNMYIAVGALAILQIILTTAK